MTINILGMGPGHRDYVTGKALKIIEDSEVIIGGNRILKDYGSNDKELLAIGSNLKEIIQYLNKNKYEKNIAVLLSGDTGYYSMLTYIKKNIDDHNALNVIPGISSFQYLFAKIKKTWQNAYLGSVHGRELDYINILRNNSMVVLLTDNKNNSPSNIARKLLDEGFHNCTMYVGEELSYDNEKITKGRPDEIVNKEFGMSVVVIENE